MESVPQTKEKTSLTMVFQSLSETGELLEQIREQLDYTVNGAAVMKEKPISQSNAGAITIEMIGNKMFQLARQASEISKLTHNLVGN
jgi:hypothetical protein